MNKITINTLVLIYRLCKRLRQKIFKLLQQDKILAPPPYVALTPTEITGNNEYFNALNFALSKSDIRNIAVTGSYGAGKSTIIRSYMEKFRPGAFINVSLAGFEMQEKGEPAKAQEVELSILQQILYKKNRDALPDSRIDRILNRNQAHIRRVFLTVLKVAAPLCVILALIYHEKFLALTGLPGSLFSFISVIPYPKAIILLVCILAALYFITECASQIGIFDKKIKLNKVALLSGEMDLSSAETSSLLNNCLDEIVYFFSRIDNYRIVIFEDLDRLKTPEIFVKLREINKIVNNNLSDENPLRFVYAVRDDIFSGAEARTKFFDFIIPVVPVMDSRNAFSLLNHKMKSIMSGGEECLRSTAVYISDMRSLQNIINEYRVFSEVVDNKKDTVSLYAMVFYKNMFAHDYSLIDKKVSILYKFIYHYRTLELHEDYFGSLDAKISSLGAELNRIREEKLRTAEDVRKDLLYALIPQNLTQLVHFYRRTDGNSYYQPAQEQLDTLQLISDEKAFENLLETSSQVSIGYLSQNRYQVIVLPDSERAEIYDSYQLRKKAVGEERELNFRKTEKAFREAREDKRRKNAISLSGLVTIMKRDKFTGVARQYMDEISQHDLLSAEQKKAVLNEMQYGGYDALYLLLSRGYLDQDFMRSRSVFHPGGLSVSDNEFIKNIALGLAVRPANLKVVIDDVAGVIREIAAQRLLHQDAVMHHQIVAHMLDTNDGRLDEMIATLFSRPGEYVLSLLSILESRFTAPESFPSLLRRALEKNDYLDTLLGHLETAGGDDASRSIAAEVVSLIAPSHSQVPGLYRRYVQSLGTGIVLQFRSGRLEAFLNHIAELQVSYETLSGSPSEDEQACLRFIGEKSLYRLTQANTGVILAAQLSEHGYTEVECENTPWTLAQKHQLAALAYFEEHADDFVRSVFLASEEQGAAVVAVLQLSALSDDMKIRIVREMNFCLVTLAGIPAEPAWEDGDLRLSFHDAFYRYDRIEAAWPELMNYIAEECCLRILTGFLSRHAAALSLSGPAITDESLCEPLYAKILCNQLLSEEDYIKVISNVDVRTADFDGQIGDDILIRLLKLDKIPLSRDDFLNVMNTLSDVNDRTCDVIAAWLVRYDDELMSDPDYYLYKDDDVTVFERLLDRVMHAPLLLEEHKLTLFGHYADYYREADEDNIRMPDSLKISAFKVSSDDDMKLHLFSSLIVSRYRNRPVLADMAGYLQEKELQKIFSQKTGATLSLTDRERCRPLIVKLLKAGLIKEYEFRDDGKVFVGIRGSDSSESAT